ncbi:hypothetical protein CWATWH0003_2764b6, partial [Crocosphaera watsonii WH 0003]
PHLYSNGRSCFTSLVIRTIIEY